MRKRRPAGWNAGYMPLLDYAWARPRWFFALLTAIERRTGRQLW